MAQTPRLQSLVPGAPMPDVSLPPVEAKPLSMVEVVNRNGFILRDMYDGVPYVFRPNQMLSIPPNVANHIFGWPAEGDVMRLHTCRRFGWNTPAHMEVDKNRPHDNRTVADIYFANIEIRTVEYDFVKREPSGVPMPEESELADRPEMDARAAPRGSPDLGGDTRVGLGRQVKKVDL